MGMQELLRVWTSEPTSNFESAQKFGGGGARGTSQTSDFVEEALASDGSSFKGHICRSPRILIHAPMKPRARTLFCFNIIE